MKIAEVRELNNTELIERIDVDSKKYHQMLINHSVSPLDNPAQIKELRRTIARLKTELRLRELNQK